jgi:hypothetical protein
MVKDINQLVWWQGSNFEIYMDLKINTTWDGKVFGERSYSN